MPNAENMIAALKRERAGYVARGLTDRVRQVDEQLAHYGVRVAEPTVEPDRGPVRTATSGKSRKAIANGE